MTIAEREELFTELQALRKSELVRLLAHRLRVKAVTLRDKAKAELIWALADAGLG